MVACLIYLWSALDYLAVGLLPQAYNTLLEVNVSIRPQVNWKRLKTLDLNDKVPSSVKN
jgi:hypothetical protein